MHKTQRRPGIRGVRSRKRETVAGVERGAVQKRDQRRCSHSKLLPDAAHMRAGCTAFTQRWQLVACMRCPQLTAAGPCAQRRWATFIVGHCRGRQACLWGTARPGVQSACTGPKTCLDGGRAFEEWVGRPAHRAGTTPPQAVFMQSAERAGLCQGAKSAACDAGRHVATPPLRVTVSSA